MASPPIHRIDPDRPAPDALQRAVDLLSEGKCVVFPTETVYGIGVDFAVPGARERLYRAKGRSADKPVAFFVTGPAMIREQGASWDGRADRLAAAFWPGPLTLVLPHAGGWTGYRVPDHPVASGLARLRGGPLAVTSANRSGEPDARTAEEALASLGSQVDLILDGGPVRLGKPSTVVAVEADAVRVLRESAISAVSIEKILST